MHSALGVVIIATLSHGLSSAFKVSPGGLVLRARVVGMADLGFLCLLSRRDFAQDRKSVV